MTQCNSCCFHYQCGKEQDHDDVHVFSCNANIHQQVRRICWMDYEEESK